MLATPPIDASSPHELLRPAIVAGQRGVMPPEEETRSLARSAHLLREAAPEAIYQILTPALVARSPDVALQWLRDAGFLVELMPELDATVAFSQEGGRRHKDVWEHTKEVVRQSVPRPAVRWAAALHDIGKVPTRRFLKNGKVTFRGHAEEGARMFRRGPRQRIGFPTEVADRVEVLILHHLRPGQYDRTWTDAAVRRFARDMRPWLTDLLDLGRADVTSKRPGKRKRCLAAISELAARIRELDAQDNAPRPLPPGLGNALMEALGLPPGKHIGELRERLEALHAAGEVDGGLPAEAYVEVVEDRNLMEGIQIRPPRGFSR